MEKRPEEPIDHHLVFVHGGGVGPWMWRRQREHFGGRYGVHTPTLPGHEPGNPTVYRSHAEAARAIAGEIGLEGLGGSVTVVGFSVGGQVALELARANPAHVSRTVVVSSLLSPWRGARLVARVSSAAAPLARVERFARLQARGLSLHGDELEEYLAVSRSMTASSLENLLYANFSFKMPAEVVRPARPLLFVAGSRERRTLIAGMERASALLPNSRLALIDGAGHDAPFAQPERFNQALESWMAS